MDLKTLLEPKIFFGPKNLPNQKLLNQRLSKLNTLDLSLVFFSDASSYRYRFLTLTFWIFFVTYFCYLWVLLLRKQFWTKHVFLLMMQGHNFAFYGPGWCWFTMGVIRIVWTIVNLLVIMRKCMRSGYLVGIVYADIWYNLGVDSPNHSQLIVNDCWDNSGSKCSNIIGGTTIWHWRPSQTIVPRDWVGCCEWMNEKS